MSAYIIFMSIKKYHVTEIEETLYVTRYTFTDKLIKLIILPLIDIIYKQNIKQTKKNNI
jgi:hypothetical protein